MIPSDEISTLIARAMPVFMDSQGLPETKTTGRKSGFVSGPVQRMIRLLMLFNAYLVSIGKYRDPLIAWRKMVQLYRARKGFRGGQRLSRYARAGKRCFISFVIPGWPSRAFNRSIRHQLSRLDPDGPVTLCTVIMAVTKKCGFQCQHCFEWHHLNQPETLSNNDLQEMIRRVYRLGVSQIQLSGGEPLNRLSDILQILHNAPGGIDFWLYTSGYSLTPAKSRALKKAGLTGITISLDHWESSRHDAFRGVRGSFDRALQSIAFAREAGLSVCLSLCATPAFTNPENLARYRELARTHQVSFIQVLEPRMEGRWAGKDLLLSQEQLQDLEDFFLDTNLDPNRKFDPLITYHGFVARGYGCNGAGGDYVYTDTDGYIHECPFCVKRSFSVFDPSLAEKIRAMRTKGCTVYSSCK